MSVDLKITKVFTSPPTQKKWKGLTCEEKLPIAIK